MNYPQIHAWKTARDSPAHPRRRTRAEWEALARAYREWARVNLRPEPRAKFSRRKEQG